MASKHPRVPCECGLLKDYRAKRCSACAKSSTTPEFRAIKVEAVRLAMSAGDTTIRRIAERAGVNRHFVKTALAELGFDFNQLRPTGKRGPEPEHIFTIAPKRRNAPVLAYIRRHDILPDSCAMCGIGPEWNGQPLKLQLDHIDGNACNNLLGNLRILCPNCHTQTDTFTGRNTR